MDFGSTYTGGSRSSGPQSGSSVGAGVCSSEGATGMITERTNNTFKFSFVYETSQNNEKMFQFYQLSLQGIHNFMNIIGHSTARQRKSIWCFKLPLADNTKGESK